VTDRGGSGTGRDDNTGFLARLEKLIDHISWLGAVVGAGIVIAMLAIVGYSVVKRYVFDTPVTWSDELSGYLVVALVMLGAAEALRRGDHINVDFLSARATGGVRRALEIWGYAAVAVVSVALLVSTVEMLRFSFDFDIVSEGYLEVPMWVPQSFLLLGAVLLLIASAVRILRLLIRRETP